MESLLQDIPDSLESLSSTPKLGKSEPNDQDLMELEALLDESIQLKEAKSNSSRSQYKRLKAENDSKEYQPEWFVLQTISVWVRYSCPCGHQSPIFFNRYMRQLRQVGSRTIVWETIEKCKVEQGNHTDTIVERAVPSCEHCHPRTGELKPFQEVIDGQTEENNQTN